jgi:hypothetical protein
MRRLIWLFYGDLMNFVETSWKFAEAMLKCILNVILITTCLEECYMKGFITTKEASEKWNISIRQVQNRCKNGRIKGVERAGQNYLISEDAKKPVYCLC